MAARHFGRKAAPGRVVAITGTAMLAAWPMPVTAASDEIIVTARKREETLHEIPLSISTFDDKALRERNIQTIYDVATFTPNFSFNRNTVGRRLDAPAIRGQFTPLQNFGSEGNVAFYVDGVYVSGTASSLTTDNVERIEVIKGPQAALFGRAAFAGAVNYITRQPTNEIEGQVSLKAGEEQDYKTSVWVSGPLVEDKLLFFVAAGYESFAGEWRNTLVPCDPPTSTGPDCVTFNPAFPNLGGWPAGQPASTVVNDTTELGGESGWNTTGKLLWNAADNLAITFKADYTESDDDHFASLFQPNLNCQVVPGGAPWFCGELKADDLRSQMNLAELRLGATSTTMANGQAIEARPAPFIGTQTETQRYLLEGVLGVGTWEVVARATRNRQQLESYRDLDRSPYLGPLYVNLFTAGELQRWRDQSYEVRATSDQAQRLRGTLGAYYFDAEQESYQREFTGFCNRVEYGLPYVNGRPSWNLNAEKRNVAAFGGVDYGLTDTVTVSVEARYAKDTPEQHSPSGVTARETYKSFTPRLILQWQPDDDLNLFAKASKGNKPGGFFYGYFDAPVVASATLASLQPDAQGRRKGVIEEEEAWTYELGAKTRWLDRRVTANISVFYIDWTNQAINEVDNIPWFCADTNTSSPVANNFIRNAGESQVVGGEVELGLQATDNLYLSLNYGLQDTKLEDYFSLVLQEVTLNGNARGKEAPRVPKHTVTASGVYSQPFGDRGSTWFLRADYVHNSKSYVDVDNFNWIGPLTLVNARIGIENESVTAAFYIDNLTDTDTPLLASEFPNFADFPLNVTNSFHIVPRRSRNAGLTLQYRF